MGWIALFILNYLLFGDDPRESTISLLNWVGFILLFYVNYIILIPKLLFRNRTTLYILSAMLLIAATYVTVRADALYDSERRIERMPEQERRDMPSFYREIEQGSIFKPQLYNPFIYKHATRHFYGLLLIYLLSTLLRLVGRWQEQERRQIELEKEQAKSELDYLKKQINPHFLFNALNSIYSLTLSQDDQASESVLKLSSILRYMLYETDNTVVMLSSEVDILYSYLGLQKLRLTDMTEVNFEIDGSLEGYGIEPLLLIPFIENAFKYGIDSAHKSFINIYLSVKDSSLLFRVENKVVKPNRPKPHSGIGVRNIVRRLEILYPDSHRLDIAQEKDVFKVVMSLPLKRV